jgi:hypothetical protein
MLIHKESHIRSHGLTGAQLAFLLDTFADRRSFFIESVRLPDELGTVQCGLVGPVMGDPIVLACDTWRTYRVGAKWESRMLSRTAREQRPHLLTRRTSWVTVIAGPHEEHACILYTAFGGPLAPKEVDDPSLTDEKRAESIAFWSEHALAF